MNMCQVRLWLIQFVVLLSVFLVVSAIEAVKLNFEGSWRREVGWELVCSWSFAGRGTGDHLQSTRLFRDGKQFMIYRPDINGPRHVQEFPLDDSNMRVVCIEQESHRGICVLTMEPTKPPASVVQYTCEVSGERPTFLQVSKDYLLEACVPTEDTRIEARLENDNVSNRVLLNCTSTGIPAPNLVWTVDNQIVPADFTGRFWNSSMKSEQAWSSLAVSPKSSTVLAMCTPKQLTFNKDMVLGLPAEFLISSASAIYGKYYTAVFLAIIKLLR